MQNSNRIRLDESTIRTHFVPTYQMESEIVLNVWESFHWGLSHCKNQRSRFYSSLWREVAVDYTVRYVCRHFILYKGNKNYVIICFQSPLDTMVMYKWMQGQGFNTFFNYIYYPPARIEVWLPFYRALQKTFDFKYGEVHPSANQRKIWFCRSKVKVFLLT